MRHETRKTKKWAFTIVELLTVMGVIALLIGLLAPALNAVRRIARDTKQRAQFNSVRAGLELFKNDQGDYPDSTALSGTVGQTGVNATSDVITGSQRLAEALLGRDLQGFDTVSLWHPVYDVGNGTTGKFAYGMTSLGSLDPTELTKSLDRRKGPYLEVENVGAFNIDKLYQGSTNIHGTTVTVSPYTGNDPAPFITDVYTDKTITIDYQVGTNPPSSKTVRVGTPILYYKANPANKSLLRPHSGTDFSDCTYDYWDNGKLLEMGKLSSPTTQHPMANSDNSYEKFYEVITNYQIPSNEGIAYRPDSYILMSAGRDGLFGTTDDIYNFGD